MPQNYDVSLINASANLKELAKGIKESKNARLCLYGPAGTGKSEYAKFIAKSLNSKLIIKKASDLIDCYVGNTEKNIANAFKEAKDQNAVLVFDEIDSFLQDRTDAVRRWEITQVNEMLVQMESFDGVFIATTNLMDRLDRASIRRFDMKIEFGYMDGAQAAKLLQKECESLGIGADKAAKNSVAKIKFLTPGDFAAVARSAKFSPILGVGEFIDRLKLTKEYEKKLKREQRKLSRRCKLAKDSDKKLSDSKNYQKQKKKVAKIHNKIRNKRKDFINKLSTKIINNHDIICIEDLNIKGMLKNHKLAKSISDVSWSEFRRQLEYKANWYGRKIVKVPIFYPSSKTCSSCGNIKETLKLSERIYHCECCGLEIDRDYNASINILRKGLEILKEEKVS